MDTGIVLIQVGCAIYILLGLVHAYLTLCTNAMEPENPELLALNKASHSRITRQTTLWAGGVGFHLSHSLGMAIFGVIIFAVLGAQPALLISSSVLAFTLLCVPVLYLLMSLKYWFIVPTVGLGIACGVFVVGMLMQML